MTVQICPNCKIPMQAHTMSWTCHLCGRRSPRTNVERRAAFKSPPTVTERRISFESLTSKLIEYGYTRAKPIDADRGVTVWQRDDDGTLALVQAETAVFLTRTEARAIGKLAEGHPKVP